MRLIATDGVAWSVCLSVGHIREPCKNCRTDLDGVWATDSGGPNEPVLNGGPDPPRGRFNIWGWSGPLKITGVSEVSYAQTVDPIETCGPKETCIRWGSMSNVRVTSWRCGFLSRFFDNL